MNKQPFPHPVENFCGKGGKLASQAVENKIDEKSDFAENILTQDMGISFRHRWPRH